MLNRDTVGRREMDGAVSIANQNDIGTSGWIDISAARLLYSVGKRTLDLSAALCLLLLLFPLLLFAIAIVKISSPGPAIFIQSRVGRGGRRFRLYKIRTMVVGAEAATGPVWASHHDSRVIGFGRFLRRSHFDELPQLWNVLRGDMSLIGPRPERPAFADSFVKTIPSYAARFAVRPGITGLAQVRQHHDRSIQDVKRKLKYDRLYISEMCWCLDVFIIWETVKKVAAVGRAAQ